tara:strand:+ start:242 stop:628 length:387 start_codon:yes stop_codon:yes gene_type:complete
MSNPFDYVNQILQGKKQLIVDEVTEKAYEPFLMNRALSQHKDCVLFANEMNQRHHLDKKMQNDFLLNTVRSVKRSFAKWAKSEKDDDIACVKMVYGLSDGKARDAMRLLTKEQIQQLKKETLTGGLGK